MADIDVGGVECFATPFTSARQIKDTTPFATAAAAAAAAAGLNALLSERRYAFLVEAVEVYHQPNLSLLAGELAASKQQQSILAAVLSILSELLLARNATLHTDSCLVTIHRQTDRASESLRHIFGSCRWSPDVLRWVSCVIFDTEPSSIISVYIDTLRVLHGKLHGLEFTNKLSDVSLCCRFSQQVLAELQAELQTAVRTPFPPFPTSLISSVLPESKHWEFAAPPLLVLCPGDRDWNHPQLAYWKSKLATFGDARLVVMTMSDQRAHQKASRINPTQHIVSRLKEKVLKLQEEFVNRPVILVGKGVGGRIACEVASLISVTAVVCLGFPLLGLNGLIPDDPLFKVRSPVLFVIGSKAFSAPLPLMEKVRRQMRAQNVLAVIDGAGDSLRLSPFHARLGSSVSANLVATPSQDVIDSRIIQAIGSFIQSAISRSLKRRRLQMEEASHASAPVSSHAPASSATAATAPASSSEEVVASMQQASADAPDSQQPAAEPAGPTPMETSTSLAFSAPETKRAEAMMDTTSDVPAPSAEQSASTAPLPAPAAAQEPMTTLPPAAVIQSPPTQHLSDAASNPQLPPLPSAPLATRVPSLATASSPRGPHKLASSVLAASLLSSGSRQPKPANATQGGGSEASS